MHINMHTDLTMCWCWSCSGHGFSDPAGMLGEVASQPDHCRACACAQLLRTQGAACGEGHLKLFTVRMVLVLDLGSTPPPQNTANSARPREPGCRADVPRGSSPTGHPSTNSPLPPSATQPTLPDAAPPQPSTAVDEGPQKRQLSRLGDSSRPGQRGPSSPVWARVPGADQPADAGPGQRLAPHAGSKAADGAHGDRGASEVQAARGEAARKLPAPAKPKLRLPAVPRRSPPVPAGQLAWHAVLLPSGAC